MKRIILLIIALTLLAYPAYGSQWGGTGGGVSQYARSSTLVVCASDAEDTTDCDYLCDGAADEVQINAAIDALPSGKGKVILSEGTFDITSAIDIDHNFVMLEGQGRGSILLANASYSCGNEYNPNGIVEIEVSYNNATVRDLTIDGLYPTRNSNGCAGIYFKSNSNSNLVENVYFKDNRNGIYMYAGSFANGTKDNIITHNTFGGTGGVYGIWAYFSQRIVVKGNIFQNVLSAGIQGNGGGQNSGWTISNNLIRMQNGSYYGISTYHEDSVIEGNIIVGDGIDGIFHSGDNAVISNNIIVCSNSGADGIALSGATGCVIAGNYIEQNSGQVSIRFNTGCNDNITIGNTGPNYKIYDGATGNRVFDIYNGDFIHYTSGLDTQYDVQKKTVADSGDGNPATDTLSPVSSYIEYTCNDSDGCDITMGETGILEGSVIEIVNVSANPCFFSDSAGVSELGGDFVMNQYQSLRLRHDGATWVEISRSMVTERTVFIPIGWMLDGAAPPDTIETIASSNRKVEVRTFAGDTADEDVEFSWYVPDDLYGGIIQYKVITYVTSASPPSNKGWSFFLHGCSTGTGDNLGCTLGTAVESNITGRSDIQYDLVQTSWSGDVTITDMLAGEVAQFKLYRDYDDADDTYEDLIGVAGIVMRYYIQ